MMGRSVARGLRDESCPPPIGALARALQKGPKPGKQGLFLFLSSVPIVPIGPDTNVRIRCGVLYCFHGSPLAAACMMSSSMALRSMPWARSPGSKAVPR